MSERDTNGGRIPRDSHVDDGGIPLLPGLSPDRRAFLKLVGFSFASAMLAGCGRGTEQDAVPFLERPEEVTPGTATWYAGLCAGCPAACGTLMKVRDGRPIKIEGNELDAAVGGGRTCAVGQAQVLSLYDGQRLRQPLAAGKPATWAAVDAAVRSRLAEVAAAGTSVCLLTGTLHGPTEREAVRRFLAAHPKSRHVMYDTLSASALREAHARRYGAALTPRYRIENARVLVSVDADFLGTWISPVEFTRGWSAARRLTAETTAIPHHVQFEARVSLSGTNADQRFPVPPSQLRSVLGALATRVARATGTPAPWGGASDPTFPDAAAVLDDVAARLLAAPRGRALVLCGTNDVAAQELACHLNHVLGADDPDVAERTVDLQRPSQQRLGDDRALAALLDDLRNGRVGALLVAGCNPVYDLPEGAALAEALARTSLVVSFADRVDETAAHAAFVCPDHHPLEAWRDAEPVRGVFTLGQPAIRPLGQTRAFVESLGAWSTPIASARDLMRAVWKSQVLDSAAGGEAFETAWHRAVHDGVVRTAAPATARRPYRAGTLSVAASEATADALEVVLYAKTGLPDGRHAHNPWLQELPDPVSKISWDNYACLGPATAGRLGLVDGDVVELSATEPGGLPLRLPTAVQRGQAEGVVAVALGYGREGTDRFAKVGPQWIEGQDTVEAGATIGVNAAPLAGWQDGQRRLSGRAARLRATGTRLRLARTQIYDSLDVPAHLAPAAKRRRAVAPHTTWSAYAKDPAAGSFHGHAFEELWEDDHPFDARHWGLAVDLNACTGCAACVLACQAENNIPVVGRDEVRRQREMHWLRIDRYFQGEGANLHTVHQPMMCQQCDHAPCETVCPVLATVHSSEGLNQQVYNRCVGTRYCSNNCPYKVRRFNWFDYPREDRLQNMALNPDVTVRSRGVMEKCTFCVQRIQEAKAQAKREGREVADGDIRTACQQVCPADAVVFGDMNDPASKVTGHMRSPRANRVLGELGVRPSVAYLTQVRDRGSEGDEHD